MKFSFWKTFGTNVLAIIVTGLILMFIFFGWLGFMLGSFDSWFTTEMEKPDLEDKTVLKLDMKGPFTETSGVEFSGGPMPFDLMTNTGTHDLIIGINEAQDDRNVKGILLDLDFIGAGWATTREVRNALLNFKKSGKFVYAYGEVLSQKAYYLASVADSIYLYPTGVMALTGLSANLTFVKGLFEKMDLDMQIIRGSNNRFKSAVEPLIREDMSNANREQTKKYVRALWNTCIQDISESRGISKDELNRLADSILVRNPKDALKYGLIDKIVYRDQLESSIRLAIDEDPDEDIEYYSCEKYARRVAFIKRDKWDNSPNIAVIYAEGSIMQGKSDVGSIGSDTYFEAIHTARMDENVKAIVLRVNSPGGDALASDIIWRELVLAAKEKPLIVSMGDVAASGGYYISAPADKIFAQENTITGSIGVFLVWPNTKTMFNKHLGITFDTVKTNMNSDFLSVTRPLSDLEKEIFQEGVDEVYLDFITKVDEGREQLKSTDEVDSIGQGRVWSGIDARSIGLVDEFGGIEDAVAEAADQAGIDQDDVKILTLPERKISKFINLITAIERAEEEEDDDNGNNDARIKSRLESAFIHQWEYLKDLRYMSGYQARMMWNIRVE